MADSSPPRRDHDAEITYQVRPYVCGAIGPWDATALCRLRDASPGRLREVHRTSLAVLLATGTPAKWKVDRRRGYFWGDLAEGASPITWSEAAEQRLAAGLQIVDQEVILHTDGLGFQDLYIRRHRDALYFSVRIKPLLDIVDGSLHTDWSAWASIFALTCPLGSSTPFQEVRRMEAATAWRARPGRLDRVTFEPTWLKAEPDGRVTASEAVNVIAENVRRVRRPAIPLSGGWDSRLLAILARSRRRRMAAWTTSNDDGHDNDIEYARQVAEALGLRHRIFVPSPDAWLDEHYVVWRRVNFQTTHHVWIMPLARLLRRQRDEFLDGLAGDILFNAFFVNSEVANAASPRRQRWLQWNALEQKRLQKRDLLAPGIAATFEELSRASLDESVSKFDGHPAAPTLNVLYTRTARAIASASQWLLAPEVAVSVPFAHPDVIATALRVPLSSKFGGNFYRAMLHALNPMVAALPSTNDAVKPGGTRGDRRQANSKALVAMAATILSDNLVLQLFGPEIRQALKDPSGLALVSRSSASLRMLQSASLLGGWRATYKTRLADYGFDPSDR